MHRACTILTHHFPIPFVSAHNRQWSEPKNTIPLLPPSACLRFLITPVRGCAVDSHPAVVEPQPRNRDPPQFPASIVPRYVVSVLLSVPTYTSSSSYAAAHPRHDNLSGFRPPRVPPLPWPLKPIPPLLAIFKLTKRSRRFVIGRFSFPPLFIDYIKVESLSHRPLSVVLCKAPFI